MIDKITIHRYFFIFKKIIKVKKMKSIKILSVALLLGFLSTASIAETKDCSQIKADTGAKMLEKWKCNKGIEGEGLGTKIKNLANKLKKKK